MNDSDLLPDDPKLTAYALGELEGDERAAVEAAVRADATLRAAVEEIRATAWHIQSALAAEAATPLEGEGVEAIGRDGGETTAGGREEREARAAYASPRGAGRLIRFPQFYYLAGGLAAAGFAVLVALNRDEYAAREAARAESLRMALEQQAAEARAAASAGNTRVVVNLPETPAPVATEPAVGVEIATAPATSAGRGSLAPEDLKLLRQVQPTPLASSAPATAAREAAERPVSADTAMDRRREVGPANVPPARGSLATTAAGPSEVPSRPAGAAVATAPSAPERVTIDYVPSTRNLDARYGLGEPNDLFPGPSKVFAPPATSAAPTGEYSKMPTKESEVVMLDAFTVRAQRPLAYGASSAARRSEYDPWVEDRDSRPRAPTGARFGRNPPGAVRDNDFVRAAAQPLSTFAVDSDATSYGSVRRALARREIPARESVKIEELLNYFPYRYPEPAPPRVLSFLDRLRGEDGAPPFAAALEVAEAPWRPQHRLVRIGLKGREIPAGERMGANLVFLIDVSASMNEPNRLPLVKESLRLLLERLRADDRIAIVTYGGDSGLVLPPTPVSRMTELRAAIDALAPGAAPNGAAGIRLAYDIAQGNFTEEGVNRVILCTDGDFAVGASSDAELLRLVHEKADSGVFLTVLGFGMGSYRDDTLEQLAEHGNGHYGYIDSRREAQKLLVEQVSSTLVTIAKDVKIQVDFNPAKVSSYRLIGYENRLLRREDFNDDQVDGGEIGAGHTVTALYEIVPVGVESPAVTVAPMAGSSRYTRAAMDDAGGRRWTAPRAHESSHELLTVTVRYKKPDGWFGRKVEFPLVDAGARFADASADFRFAAAVAEFGMILRNSAHKGAATLGDVIAWAAAAAAKASDDPGGYRGEFIDLARQAQELLRTE